MIDLVRFDGITLSEDKSSAIIEPGNTWASTYENLQKSGMTIPGGRMFGVGVGGLTLGGESTSASKPLFGRMFLSTLLIRT